MSDTSQGPDRCVAASTDPDTLGPRRPFRWGAVIKCGEPEAHIANHGFDNRRTGSNWNGNSPATCQLRPS